MTENKITYKDLYIGQTVYHNDIYNAKQHMEVTGITKTNVQLTGDYCDDFIIELINDKIHLRDYFRSDLDIDLSYHNAFISLNKPGDNDEEYKMKFLSNPNTLAVMKILSFAKIKYKIDFGVFAYCSY